MHCLNRYSLYHCGKHNSKMIDHSGDDTESGLEKSKHRRRKIIKEINKIIQLRRRREEN